MATVNIRRGLKRVWIVASVLWIAFSFLLVGDPAFRSAKGLWLTRNNDRPNVASSETAQMYSSKPDGVQAVHMRGPDDHEFWIEEKQDRNQMWAALYVDLKDRALRNFKTLAWVTTLPLAFFWSALYAGFWIVRGFHGTQPR